MYYSLEVTCTTLIVIYISVSQPCSWRHTNTASLIKDTRFNPSAH